LSNFSYPKRKRTCGGSLGGLLSAGGEATETKQATTPQQIVLRTMLAVLFLLFLQSLT